MDVIVIGGGMAGVATAHALHARGHQVRVLERQGTVAQGATFGQNAAALPSPLDVWFGPGLVDCQPRTLFGRRREATVLDGGGRRQARGFARRLAQTADPEAFATQFGRLKPLADLSDAILTTLGEGEGAPDFELRAGIAHLFDTDAGFAAAAPAMALLRSHGIAHRLLDGAQIERLESALGRGVAAAGGVLLPQATSGNCALLAKQLKALLERGGVHFLCGREALRMNLDGPRASVELGPAPLSVHGQGSDRLEADAIVVAAGAGAPALLGRPGFGNALGAAHCHALSAPIAQQELAPGLPTIVDTARRISLTRFNHRIRVTGGARVHGPATLTARRPPVSSDADLDALGDALHRWLPGIARVSGAHAWEGVKLLSADGLPLVGRGAHPRLWINCAHGPAGWALTLGAANLLADLLDGRRSPLPDETIAAVDPLREARAGAA